MATEKLRFEFDGDASKFKQAIQQSNKSVNNFGSNLTKIGGIIAGAFAVDRLIEFGSAIIETTSSFERFEAVLTNTLGSKSEAQKALSDITEFASKTPFSVLELTDSFVRLANQGFKPTRDEMRKLGDLASSTGKQFDQLAEAVIDAQVGEFERLKEFGIRASKQGDKVTFTFKGVKKQVDFTAQSIQDYVLSLGDIEGVSGAMESISKTLGGQISNLGDSFDSLKFALGQELKPVLEDVIGSMSSLLTKTTEFLQTGGLKKLFGNLISAVNPLVGSFTRARGEAQGLAKDIIDLALSSDELEKKTKDSNQLSEAQIKVFDSIDKKIQTLSNKFLIYGDSVDIASDATKILGDGLVNLMNVGIDPANEKFKKLQDQFKSFEVSDQLKQIPVMLEATAIELDIANLKQQELGETSKVTGSAFGELADGMRQIGMTVGMAFAQMAMQGQKSIQQIINSLAQMIVQMGIALIIGTVLKSLFDPSATAVTAKNLATVGAVVAGAGILSMISRDNTGNVQGFAHGGIVTKPTMGIIGEAGQSEAVIPLNRLPQMMGAIGGNQKGEFTLRGQDLILALERAGDFRARITG